MNIMYKLLAAGKSWIYIYIYIFNKAGQIKWLDVYAKYNFMYFFKEWILPPSENYNHWYTEMNIRIIIESSLTHHILCLPHILSGVHGKVP